MPRIQLVAIVSVLTLLFTLSVPTAGFAGPAGPVAPSGESTPDADGTPAAGVDDSLLDPDYDLGGVVGPAIDLVGEGEEGEVSIVSYLLSDAGYIAVLRNGTDEPVGNITVLMTVRDGDGELIAVGGSSGQRYPAYVPAGGIAMTELALQGATSIPDDATVEFTVQVGEPADGAGDITENDIVIDEVNVVDDTLIGTGHNAAEVEGYIPILLGACFDDDGQVTALLRGTVEPSTVEPGDDVTFSADLPAGCDSYLVSIVA